MTEQNKQAAWIFGAIAGKCNSSGLRAPGLGHAPDEEMFRRLASKNLARDQQVLLIMPNQGETGVKDLPTHTTAGLLVQLGWLPWP